MYLFNAVSRGGVILSIHTWCQEVRTPFRATSQSFFSSVLCYCGIKRLSFSVVPRWLMDKRLLILLILEKVSSSFCITSNGCFAVYCPWIEIWNKIFAAFVVLIINMSGGIVSVYCFYCYDINLWFANWLESNLVVILKLLSFFVVVALHEDWWFWVLWTGHFVLCDI